MTVASQTARNRYLGDGSTILFPYTFKVFENSDLVVALADADGVETVQTITTHYSVSGAGDDSGGNVIMVTAPASGEVLTITRGLTIKQEVDLVDNDPFNADTIETAFDRQTMIAQQQQEELNRTVKVPVTSETNPDELIDDITDAKVAAQTAQSAAETAQGLAETAQSLSEDAQALSETARDKAQDWANEDEDVEVAAGLYSAKHFAAKAQSVADGLAQASETQAGIMALATQVEVNDGTVADEAVTPATLAGRTATDTRAGIVELATPTESATGSDTERAVTPSGLVTAIRYHKGGATVNQSGTTLTTGVWTEVELSAEGVDPGGLITVDSGTNRITFAYAGTYEVELFWEVNNSPATSLAIKANGSTVATFNTNSDEDGCVAYPVTVGASGYITFEIYHNYGSNQAVTAWSCIVGRVA